ncbi:PEST proteolytic signal-containing nuclear protein-like isoform X1 [Mytilus edulis]|uniref:PEST proteolytic signal-containing nuclear protein-like isoform X1 n=2 Tax=Mytilus edulis TaxID=6550 RepID=UPI0039EEF1BD
MMSETNVSKSLTIIPLVLFVMAENASGAVDVKSSPQNAEKRKFEEKGDGEPVEKKKITMSFGEPVEKKKITMSFGIKKKTDLSANSKDTAQLIKAAPVKISLSTQKKTEPIPVKPQTAAIAKAFNQDESDEEEEMPFEAKMRMKNIGRETPTAAGPNSFGKGRLGFVDRNKAIERDIQKQLEDLGET